MPISVSINNDAQVVHTRCSGPFLPEELINYFKNTWGSEIYANYHEIFDVRDMEIQGAEFTSLLMIAKTSTKTFYDNPTTRKAIIVRNSEQKNFMDFYQSARSLLSIPGSTVKTFDSLDQAKDWLGLAVTDS